MTWKQVFTSSIGKKLVMGFTGLFLILFLIIHAGLNACIWANDNGKMFLEGAHFMGGNWVPRILEIGLFAGLILHIVQGYLLTVQNKSKRSVGYAVDYGNQGSKWYSRSMGLLGTLVLLFLILHLANFWVPNRSNQGWLLGEEINLYEKMKTEFSVLWVVIAYVLGCIALGYHLAHGFKSAFRTYGVHNKRYFSMIKGIGYSFAVIVPLIFALMPLSFYFGWIE
ncbi:succinate dehydrogenase cytochrome b subunit [Sediminibacterium soli]|uniref:succinate dehydrogenase cytochrome b subunit n=1 Tax=Sediminibacterium soli TaxID=2698829 RepID=UPI00137B5FF2|nr:succinate dehydrogenase cytochrome b subunit [Sediminibacterium soli]NCI46159.1 succinate dehydrogenase cytochrome b subunit [Sediminibacterium soli]